MHVYICEYDDPNAEIEDHLHKEGPDGFDEVFNQPAFAFFSQINMDFFFTLMPLFFILKENNLKNLFIFWPI